MSGIQTSGFVVNDRPVYTPIDVKQTTFDPQAINEGILSSYKVANEVERFNAFKALSDEVQGLRADREASAHAVYQDNASRALANLAVLPQQTLGKVRDLSAIEVQRPYKEGVALSQVVNDYGQQPIKNQMSNAELNQSSALQPGKLAIIANKQMVDLQTGSAALDRVDQTIATEDATTSFAASEAADKLSGQANEQMLRARKIQDEIDHGVHDADLRRAQAEAQLLVTQSQAAENQAKALRERAQALAPQPEKLEQNLGNYIAMEAKTKKMALADGDTVEEYLVKIGKDSTYRTADGENAVRKLRQLAVLQDDTLGQLTRANGQRKHDEASAAIVRPPVAVSFNPVTAVTTPAAQSVFDTPAQAATPSGPPVLTPEEAAKAPPGTVFQTTDGRVIRKH